MDTLTKVSTQIHKRHSHRFGFSFRLLLLLAIIVGQCCLAPFSAMAMPMDDGIMQSVTFHAVDGVVVAGGHDYCCDDAMGTTARVSIAFPSPVEVAPEPEFVVPQPVFVSAARTNWGPPPTVDARPLLQIFLI